MEITQTQQTTTTVAPPPPAEESASTQINADFEMFLQMLTAQIEYQDPLNPIESSDYATQLATFSGVEQAVLTNDLLTTLTEQLGGGTLADMAALVGKEAQAAMPAYFSGSPITLTPETTAVGDTRVLVVTDTNGLEVGREVIPFGEDEFVWAGVGTDGALLPTGLYDFTIETLSFGEVIASDAVPVYSRVTEVRFDGGDTTLLFEGGATLPSEQVIALRDPA